ncbi:MAG: DUF1062 domain-containing protein [bacterium]|nr:DUF1062 domain-containing protein [bacterium]
MSYSKIISYKIVPQESYQVIHNCPGCGGKSHFINTNTFRVNANGNRVDVWLIYQCMVCKHTLNLTIYERINPSSIPPEEYQKFLENDKELSRQYGMDKLLFSRNKKMIDQKQISYLLQEDKEKPVVKGNEKSIHKSCIEINNEHAIKIRVDKVISNLLQMTRSQEKKAEQEGRILVEQSVHQKKIMLYIK